MPPANDLPTRTITAEAIAGPARCKHCGRIEPRKDLWGINAGGATTRHAASVAYWVCAACFITPRKRGAR